MNSQKSNIIEEKVEKFDIAKQNNNMIKEEKVEKFDIAKQNNNMIKEEKVEKFNSPKQNNNMIREQKMEHNKFNSKEAIESRLAKVPTELYSFISAGNIFLVFRALKKELLSRCKFNHEMNNNNRIIYSWHMIIASYFNDFDQQYYANCSQVGKLPDQINKFIKENTILDTLQSMIDCVKKITFLYDNEINSKKSSSNGKDLRIESEKEIYKSNSDVLIKLLYICTGQCTSNGQVSPVKGTFIKTSKKKQALSNSHPIPVPPQQFLVNSQYQQPSVQQYQQPIVQQCQQPSPQQYQAPNLQQYQMPIPQRYHPVPDTYSETNNPFVNNQQREHIIPSGRGIYNMNEQHPGYINVDNSLQFPAGNKRSPFKNNNLIPANDSQHYLDDDEQFPSNNMMSRKNQMRRSSINNRNTPEKSPQRPYNNTSEDNFQKPYQNPRKNTFKTNPKKTHKSPVKNNSFRGQPTIHQIPAQTTFGSVDNPSVTINNNTLIVDQ